MISDVEVRLAEAEGNFTESQSQVASLRTALDAKTLEIRELQQEITLLREVGSTQLFSQGPSYHLFSAPFAFILVDAGIQNWSSCWDSFGVFEKQPMRQNEILKGFETRVHCEKYRDKRIRAAHII